MVTLPGAKSLLDLNGVITALASSVRMCLDKDETEAKSDHIFTQPICKRGGIVGWVEYKFQSKQLVKVFLLRKAGVVFDMQVRFFHFEDENAFRHELRRCERKLEAIKEAAKVAEAAKIGKEGAN